MLVPAWTDSDADWRAVCGSQGRARRLAWACRRYRFGSQSHRSRSVSGCA